MSSRPSSDFERTIAEALPVTFPSSLVMMNLPQGDEAAGRNFWHTTPDEPDAAAPTSRAATCGSCTPHADPGCRYDRHPTPFFARFSTGASDGSPSPAYSPRYESSTPADGMETDARNREREDGEVEEIPRPLPCFFCPNEIRGHGRCPHPRGVEWLQDYERGRLSVDMELGYTFVRGLLELRKLRSTPGNLLLAFREPPAFWAELAWTAEQLLRNEPDEIVDGQILFDVNQDFELMTVRAE
ncbi:hypothetical protein AURDEDRAFT_176882 [Auricularia subglabra TFB-10046 SS5]|uniref:Uncharacterized protein n=1 Tax=Auricularia subglabra (strain TFB-10046 / SS5) TaxID=717982 RepID=J0WNV4_AURST|nr:hypothetical protein AURDEDRAFT_176882 [Auricularia subglabra TFB-10046 SS5]